MGGTDRPMGTSWPKSSRHLPEAPLLTAEAVPANSNAASQEQGRRRQRLGRVGQGDLSQGPFSPETSWMVPLDTQPHPGNHPA